MKVLYHLIIRNNKMFRRDKSLLLFALLTDFIVLALYIIFLKSLNLNSIKSIVGEENDHVLWLTDSWMIAGLIPITAFTTTLSAFGLQIADKENQKDHDFLSSPTTRWQIQLGYMLNAIVIGFIFSLFFFVIGEGYIVISGGEWIQLKDSLQILALILLSTVLASSINLFLTLFIKTTGAFSSLSIIAGTLIGFLIGVYIPFSILPDLVQNIVKAFPLSHMAVVIRQIMTKSPMDAVFAGVPEIYIEEYKLAYGIIYKINDRILSVPSSLLFACIATLVFASLSIFIYKYKNK